MLRSLLAPKKPAEATLAACLQTLGNHFLPKPSLMVSRFKLKSQMQQEGESVSDYVASLKKLSERCEFGTFLNDLLRDRIVCGKNDKQIQTRLLEEHNLTLESVVTLAQGVESAKRDVTELSEAATSSSASINAVQAPQKKHVSCYCCGDCHFDRSARTSGTSATIARKRTHCHGLQNKKRKL